VFRYISVEREREKFGLSREELAEMLELSDYYIGQLERGERQMSLLVLVKIVSCLHISIDYLVFGKIKSEINYISETKDTCYSQKYIQDKEFADLINKCSPKEFGLIKKLIQTILPYLS
jgi:transcriptional regulator with XRE-family HTH domain